MLTVWGIADIERDLIRTRMAEGRSRAKGPRAVVGRLPAFTPAQQKEVTGRRAEGATAPRTGAQL
jgi:DNA invertase Pin-like site-specific DNA recombinase